MSSGGSVELVSQWDVLAKGRLQSHRNPCVILVDKVTMDQVNFTLVPPYPYEVCRIPLNMRPVGRQTRWERFGEAKRVFPLPGFEPLILLLVDQSLYPGSRD